MPFVGTAQKGMSATNACLCVYTNVSSGLAAASSAPCSSCHTVQLKKPWRALGNAALANRSSPWGPSADISLRCAGGSSLRSTGMYASQWSRFWHRCIGISVIIPWVVVVALRVVVVVVLALIVCIRLCCICYSTRFRFVLNVYNFNTCDTTQVLCVLVYLTAPVNQCTHHHTSIPVLSPLNASCSQVVGTPMLAAL